MVTVVNGEEYFENNKERLEEQIKNQFGNLSEEKKSTEEIDRKTCLKNINKN